jgi:hypothetical protein
VKFAKEETELYRKLGNTQKYRDEVFKLKEKYYKEKPVKEALSSLGSYASQANILAQ